jgi:hypothetical protein
MKADDIVSDGARFGESGCENQVVCTVVRNNQKRLRWLYGEVINDYPTERRPKT